MYEFLVYLCVYSIQHTHIHSYIYSEKDWKRSRKVRCCCWGCNRYIHNNSMCVWSNRVITSQTTCYNTGYCKNKIWKSISVPFPIKYLSIRFSLSNFSSFSSSELSPKPRSNTNAAPCFRDYRMKRKEQYHTKQWAFCSLSVSFAL